MTTTEQMAQALKQICAIQNKEFGLDWEEIEEARQIASSALATWEAEKASEQLASSVVKTAPERIWLNLFTTDEDTDGELLFPSDHEGITWADSEVGDHDVQYVRADLAKASEPQAERKPLTDAQIEQGRHDTFSTSNPFCPCESKTMRKAVRWAERAHGIGVKLSSQEIPSPTPTKDKES